MAPARGRRRKAAAKATKSENSTQDETVAVELDIGTTSGISSINPKENDKNHRVLEQTGKITSEMDIDDTAFQSPDNFELTESGTDVDSELLYEGEDGLATVASQEVSYAPEDVEALLGDDDNEILDNTEEYSATDEGSKNAEGGDTAASTATEDVHGEIDKTDVRESENAKTKAKLVKTTYHYVNDKTEESAGSLFPALIQNNIHI